MKSTSRDLAVALAGIFQAVKLVQQTANGQTRDEAAVDACLTGVFNTAPESVESVFGPLVGLQSGLETARIQIGDTRHRRDMDLTRYAVTVMYLERKLNKRTGVLMAIRQGVDKAREQAMFFERTHPAVIASLAECYRQTVSTLQPRIIVKGEQSILADPVNQQLIRALLLAAVRAAVLWRQCGGGRLTLILKRKVLLDATQTLLDSIRILH